MQSPIPCMRSHPRPMLLLFARPNSNQSPAGIPIRPIRPMCPLSPRIQPTIIQTHHRKPTTTAMPRSGDSGDRRINPSTRAIGEHRTTHPATVRPAQGRPIWQSAWGQFQGRLAQVPGGRVGDPQHVELPKIERVFATAKAKFSRFPTWATRRRGGSFKFPGARPSPGAATQKPLQIPACLLHQPIPIPGFFRRRGATFRRNAAPHCGAASTSKPH